MLFNSLQFAIFFPLVTLLYFLLPHRMRWALLLTASCVFYMAFIPIYILILLVTITIDYYAAIYIEQASGARRKQYLLISIVSTCVVLVLFKYLPFVAQNTAGLARLLGWNYSIHVLNLILPIGLSFHTFQSLSYVIEVYRGHQRAERHFGIYALYVMFYPQLVAGPIERPQNLLHQFREDHDFDYERAGERVAVDGVGLLQKGRRRRSPGALRQRRLRGPSHFNGLRADDQRRSSSPSRSTATSPAIPISPSDRPGSWASG